MSAFNLRNKTLSSAFFVFASNVASQLLRLISNLLLTRLLAPEMFGLMAVAYAIQFGLNLFSDIGLSQNLIQSNRSGDETYVNTLWTLQVLRGAVIFAFGLIAAGILAILQHVDFFNASTVYQDSQLPLLIILMTVTQFIMGFQSTNVAFAIRNLNMSRKVILELFGQIFSIIVTVTMSFYWRSVWPLAIGAMISALYTVYVSHRFLTGPKNRFFWDQEAVSDIVSFGKWVFFSSIVGFLSISGDRFVLGGLVSAHTLGLYTTAFFMSSSITELLNKLYAFAAYPALSEVFRTNPDQMKKVYYKLRLPIDMLCLFFSGLLFKSGHFIITILYDDRYTDAGKILEILCLSLIFNRYVLAEQCYMAIGRPKLLFPLNLIKAAGILLIMPIIFRLYGFEWALYAIALNSLWSLPLVFYYKIKFNFLEVNRELMVMPVFFVGLVAGHFFNLIIRQLSI